MNHEFDQFAKEYRGINDDALKLTGESSSFFAEYKAKKLKEWLPEKVNQPVRMLDFGCGDGVMTAFVQHAFNKASMHGIDPSSESIEVAAERFPRISFSTSEGLTINFEDNHFDVVYAAGAFHHIPFEDHDAYVAEIKRVLKPGGVFVLFELNPWNPVTVYIFNRNPIDQTAKMMPRSYSEQLLKTVGPVSTKFYSFYPGFLRWLRPTERFMTKIPFGALYACLVEKKAE
jgi:ubiquinone/menaquinone biosynthesis C-methylase UbiE